MPSIFDELTSKPADQEAPEADKERDADTEPLDGDFSEKLTRNCGLHEPSGRLCNCSIKMAISKSLKILAFTGPRWLTPTW